MRLLLPFAACVVLLPVLLVLFATVSPGLASIVGLLFALSAFVLPLVAARLSLSIGQQLTAAGAALRVACLDTLAGLREVRAFAAEGRMQALVAATRAREATSPWRQPAPQASSSPPPVFEAQVALGGKNIPWYGQKKCASQIVVAPTAAR